MTSETESQKVFMTFLLSLGSFTLEEASCHMIRTLKQLYEEVHIARHGTLLPTAIKEHKPPAICRAGSHFRQIF